MPCTVAWSPKAPSTSRPGRAPASTDFRVGEFLIKDLKSDTPETEPLRPEGAPPPTRNSFRCELQSLINCHSLENRSGTPDFLLADFLMLCAAALETTINQRDKWHHLDLDSFKRSKHPAPPADEPPHSEPIFNPATDKPPGYYPAM